MKDELSPTRTQMKATLATIAALFAASAAAQDVDMHMQVGPGGMNVDMNGPRANAQHKEIVDQRGDGFRLRYETNPSEYTVIKVVEPEGGAVKIYQDETLIHSESIPTS